MRSQPGRAVIEETQSAGARIGREPGPTFWGWDTRRSCRPDGHTWEVAHNPGWRLADDGSVRLSG
jgi:uncharacterized glyoxalase superfamily protein PhnB